MQKALNNRREFIDIALINECILEMFAWSGRVLRPRFDHDHFTALLDQQPGEGASDRAAARD